MIRSYFRFLEVSAAKVASPEAAMTQQLQVREIGMGRMLRPESRQRAEYPWKDHHEQACSREI